MTCDHKWNLVLEQDDFRKYVCLRCRHVRVDFKKKMSVSEFLEVLGHLEKIVPLEGPSLIVQGGLHLDDFERVRQNEPPGYVFVAFVMDLDNYHWTAVYARDEGQFP